MNDKLDNIDHGELYTVDYLKNTGLLSNQNSIGSIFKFRVRGDLNQDSPNVKKYVYADYNDTSIVLEVIYIWESDKQIQDTTYPSVFGDNIQASRVAQATGKFDFGIDSDGLNLQTQTGTAAFAIKGEVGHENRLSIYSGTTANSEIRVRDTEFLRYAPGYEVGAWFTIYIAGLPTGDGKIEVGLMDEDNGIGVGYKDVGNGQEFGMIVRSGGNETFIPQSEFNIDKGDGVGSSDITIDFESGNIFQIKAGYLGYAAPTLVILDEKDRFIPLHTVDYPNKNDGSTIFARTALPVSAYVTNGTTAENVEVQIGSYNAYVIDGASTGIQNRPFFKGASATFTTGANQTLIAFKNKATAQLYAMPTAKENRVSADLTSLTTTFSSSSQGATYSLVIVPEADQDDVGFTDYNTNRSIMETSTTATITSLANATYLFQNIPVSKVGQIFSPNAEQIKRKLRPGEVAFFLVSTTSTTIDVTFNNGWDELH